MKNYREKYRERSGPTSHSPSDLSQCRHTAFQRLSETQPTIPLLSLIFPPPSLDLLHSFAVSVSSLASVACLGSLAALLLLPCPLLFVRFLCLLCCGAFVDVVHHILCVHHTTRPCL